MKTGPYQSGIKQLISGEPMIMLLCLLLALCIWGVSQTRKDVRVDLMLPVEVSNIPDGFTIRQHPAGQVFFTLSGPAGQLYEARNANHSLVLALPEKALTTKTVFNHLDANLNLPTGVKALRIAPDAVLIELIKK